MSESDVSLAIFDLMLIFCEMPRNLHCFNVTKHKILQLARFVADKGNKDKFRTKNEFFLRFQKKYASTILMKKVPVKQKKLTEWAKNAKD